MSSWRELAHLDPVEVEHTVFRTCQTPQRLRSRRDARLPVSPLPPAGSSSRNDSLAPSSPKTCETAQDFSSYTATEMAYSGDTPEQMQNKLINEEYKIWKKNSVFLYDLMFR